ncbi:MAG: outer membrane protein [Bacteroidia bacterium]
MLWVQVGLMVHYGGATSLNDLTASEERYTRFYPVVGGEVGVKTGHWQVSVGLLGGRLISQNRTASFSLTWSQTTWRYLRGGVQYLILRRAFSPYVQVGAGFLNFSVRDATQRAVLPATVPTQHLVPFWSLGVQWSFSPHGALRLSYLRLPTGTDYFEGVAEGKNDRVEAMVGTLSVYPYTRVQRGREN